MTYYQRKAQFSCSYIGASNGIHIKKKKVQPRSCSKHHQLSPKYKNDKHITKILKEFYNLQLTNALLLQNLKQTLCWKQTREGSDFSNDSQVSTCSCRRPQNLRSSSSLSSLLRLEERQLTTDITPAVLKSILRQRLPVKLVSQLSVLTVAKLCLCKIKCLQLLVKPFPLVLSPVNKENIFLFVFSYIQSPLPNLPTVFAALD